MKVELTGKVDAKIDRITWDDLPLTEEIEEILESYKSMEYQIDMMEARSREELSKFYELYKSMELQNACIDMMEARNSEDILKIWSEMRNWGDRFSDWIDKFSPIRFYPNPEIFIQSVFKQSLVKEGFDKFEIDYFEWVEKQSTKINIIPETEGDILAMNQCLYDVLRYNAYHEKYHLRYVDTNLMEWTKGLRNEIDEGIKITPVSLDDYKKTYLGFIEKKIDKYQVILNISFRQLVNDELERLKLGKDLISGKELIQEEYGVYDIGDEDIVNLFTPSKFMYRIIAHDITKIILDLETGKFFPETPDTEATDKKSRSTTDVSFNWLSNPETELPPLYKKVKEAELIAPETTLKQFTAIFTGQPIETIEPVKWISKTVLLAYFIVQLRTTYNKIEETELWAIAGNCFGRNRSTMYNSYEQYLKNTKPNKKPRDHKIIDELFD